MLAGLLRTFPIDDLFAWLVQRGREGVLHLEHGPIARVFHLAGGTVTYASSNVPGEQLTQLLLGRGAIDDEALAEAIRVQGQTGVLIGKILVMTGVLDEATLREVLSAKIQDAIGDALTWEVGRFRFVPGGGDATSELEVAVALDGAVAAGLEQAERRRELKRRLPSDEAVFWIADRDQIGESFRIAACVERGLSLGQIVLEYNGNRLGVLELLVELLDEGAIKLERRTRRRSSDEQPEPAAVVEAARGRAAGGDRAGAWQLARRALEQHPEAAELGELYAGLERALLAELTRELLTSFTVPRLAISAEALAAETLDDAERYITGRIDGRWDLLSLVRTAPLGEVEALLAFRRLAARGLVRL